MWFGLKYHQEKRLMDVNIYREFEMGKFTEHNVQDACCVCVCMRVYCCYMKVNSCS